MNTRIIGVGVAAMALVFVGARAHSDDAAKKNVVKASDGLLLVYDSKGSGDTALVFLHGWCGSRHWWKSQMDAFSGDYRVIAYDQAGHGDSGKDRKEWTGAALAADVGAVVKGLGLKRVILVGHSMGGPIALERPSGCLGRSSELLASILCRMPKFSPPKSRPRRSCPRWKMISKAQWKWDYTACCPRRPIRRFTTRSRPSPKSRIDDGHRVDEIV